MLSSNIDNIKSLIIAREDISGSFFEQNESEDYDLDDLQLERSHVPSHFFVDNAGMWFVIFLFLIYIILVIIYSFVTLRKPDKVSRVISRVPVFISGINTSQTKKVSFGVDLKIVDLHHNPTILSYLNCSAVKISHEKKLPYLPSETEINQSARVYRSQNVIGENCIKPIDLNDNNEYFVQFDITEKHRLLDRHFNYGEYSKPVFKSLTFSFPKNRLYSTEFNIFSFLFDDPEYFSVEGNSSNFAYSDHSKYNSPSLSVSFTIDTNFTQFNALDFIYYYIDPVVKKYFSSLTQIFSTFVLFTLSVNILKSEHKTDPVTRILCIVLGVLCILATNPFEDFINSKVYDYINAKHNYTLSFDSQNNINDLSLRFGCFSLALLMNVLRFFICLQFCYICSHNFTSMFQQPNLTVTFCICIFYLLFAIVDYKSQYYHNKNLFRYSSLSNTNRSILIEEQNLKNKQTHYNPKSDYMTSSQKAFISPLKIEKLQILFILAHICFTIWLICISYENINDGADPNPSAENNRFRALVLFSAIPNTTAVIVHLFVSFSILQRKIFPDVLLFASNEFCVAAILLLFRGVEDDNVENGFLTKPDVLLRGPRKLQI